MRAKVEQWGGRALLYPILKDDTAALQRELCRAAAEADIVVISGVRHRHPVPDGGLRPRTQQGAGHLYPVDRRQLHHSGAR